MSVHSSGPKSGNEKELPRTIGGTNHYQPDALTVGGWEPPPVLRDEPSDYSPVVQPNSTEVPRNDPSRYQLLGEIARGGMGVVMKGRDPHLGRDLAVKVLRSELAGNAVAEQRFVEEAQVGGQLQHPGVVPVYEIGRFADGRPYFTMKLVKGRTLSALLSERASPTAERGKFLKIFEAVAQTLGYAHSKGVIHRDLKPANIMVGNFGEVQVMDWGLAKVLTQGGIADEKKEASRAPTPRTEEKTVIRTVRSGSSFGSDTEAGSMLGTPAYMPPEQAGGELDKLDERADVFGLGAILCVILTGDPPYVAETGEQVRLMSVRGKLDDAYRRVDACAADAELKAICRNCLATEPQDRPRNAGEVAALIHDYIVEVEERAHQAEVERVKADGEMREERMRRRLLTSLGGAVVATLFVGAALAGWQWMRADNEEKKTRLALAKAKEEQTRTFAALNAMSDKGIEELLTSQIEVGDEQKAFVKKVIELYDEATRSQLETPEGRAAKAHGHFSVGKLRHQIQDFPGSVESFRAAITLYESLVKDDPKNRDYRYGLANSSIHLNKSYYELKQHRDGAPYVESALELFKGLIDEDPDNADYRYGLARCHLNRAVKIQSLEPKNRTEVKSSNREGVAQFQKLVDRHPESNVFLSALILGINNIAFEFDIDPKEREELHRRAIQIGETALAKSPNDAGLLSRVAHVRNNYSAQLYAQKRHPEAEVEARAAKRIRTQLVQRFPVIRAYARDLAMTTTNLAIALNAQGKKQEAIAEHEEVANLCAALLDADDKEPDIRIRFCNAVYKSRDLSGRYVNDGKLDRAIGILREFVKANPDVRMNREYLANYLALQGRLLPLDRSQQAIECLNEAIAIYNEVLAKSTSELNPFIQRGHARTNLGNRYRNMDQSNDALQEYRAAIADYKVGVEMTPNDENAILGLTNAHQNCGNVYTLDIKKIEPGLTEYESARRYLQQLIAITPKSEYRQRIVFLDYSIGQSFAFLSKYDEAEKSQSAALAIARTLMKEPSPNLGVQRNYALVATELARLKNNQKKYDEAEKLLIEVNDLLSTLARTQRDTRFRTVHVSHIGMMAAIQARKGKYVAASQAIPQMLAIDAVQPNNYFNAACILGHCVITVGKDPTLTEQVRKDLIAGYTDQAFVYMRQGIGKGYRNAKEMETDPDLEPFRKHPEFAKILDEIKKAPTVPAVPKDTPEKK